MPFNIQGPQFKLTSQDMGGFDLGGAIRSGLQDVSQFHETRYKPANLAESLLSAQLGNKIKGVQAKYADQLAQAQLEKARRGPAPVLSNLEKAIAGTQRIKATYGADSPEAKAAASYVQRLAQGSQGLQLTTDPATGALTSLSLGGSSRGGPQSMLTT